ncbi:MAG TPA: metallophosphoesterase [Candidatus Acidoferrales bacterium]|nr:metallophosphoesterase [Candidatus Acidoferrales bacterium]
MPAVAVAAKKSGAAFYWHLGDFRKMSDVDEDIQHEPEHLGKPLTIPAYRALAWQDFVLSQLASFGSFPVYLARGNHEMISLIHPDSDYLATFAPWIDRPNLRSQRLADNPADLNPHIYYHWNENGVDFISLDNASFDFDPAQMAWFEKTLAKDTADPAIVTIVAGMHEALPESISRGHSMNQTERGTESGRRAYSDLLNFQNQAHKRVYVLASHSHYFMDGIFNTTYWREHGGVLPGWIVGTAGAQRYPLPPEKSSAKAAKTHVYGFLLGTVRPSGEIRFNFKQLDERDVPAAVKARYTSPFVHWCFAENALSIQNSGDPN